MASLKKEYTWELGKLPQGRKAVGTGWVSAKYCNSKVLVVRQMARLVAKGLTRIIGTNFQKACLPVTQNAKILWSCFCF